ncbi:Transcription factor SPEECHLESS, partial [Mucuna pruriens]
GDQASIIGGVVDYISELQQVLQSLEAKKQRKVYSEVLSPRLVSSPRASPLSPRKPPLSPRLNLPISPRTPQPGSPYRPRLQQGFSNIISNSLDPSPTSSINDNINELVANSKSATADVEVKFSGPHLLLKTLSQRIPGQPLKIITALEDLALEILHVNINSAADDTMLNSFTIKIGIECQLSAEELAQQIQQTFC